MTHVHSRTRMLVALAAVLALAAGCKSSRPSTTDAFASPSAAPWLSPSRTMSTTPTPTPSPFTPNPAASTSATPPASAEPSSGPRTFRASDNGTSLEVTTDQLSKPTATSFVLDLRVRARQGFLGCLQVHSAGDRPEFSEGCQPIAYTCTQPPKVSPQPLPPVDERRSVRVSYRSAGSVVVTVNAATSAPCRSGVPGGKPTLAFTLKVTSGRSVSNGPEPVMDVSIQSDVYEAHPKAGVTYFEGTGHDRDGYVAAMDWSFGDGSAPVHALVARGTCNDHHATTWPEASPEYTRARHAYRHPGTYTVTLTVTSTGCDGAFRQTSSIRSAVTTK